MKSKKADITEADIKIANNPTEALFRRAITNMEADIKGMEDSLIISKAFLSKAKEMAEEAKHY